MGILVAKTTRESAMQYRLFLGGLTKNAQIPLQAAQKPFLF